MHLSGVTTWASLFEPQHYEGYETEETVWQTTSASDFQEVKFSLTPLLIGSIKASLLALLIAIPVAIGAAIYTAFFAKSRLRNVIKPAIELLEAIPSVLCLFPNRYPLCAYCRSPGTASCCGVLTKETKTRSRATICYKRCVPFRFY